MELLLSLSIALVMGLFMTRLMKPLGLPAVTGYLIGGILIGPYCLGHLGSALAASGVSWAAGLGYTPEMVEKFAILSDVALGFIAFSIGSEFRLESLKKTGRQATVIGIVQALVATLFVDAALIGLHFLMPDKLPLSASVILGAVATATAPAATLMVVRQYKAKGPLTDILLPIVALDDAVGLLVFAVSFGIARAMESGNLDVVSVIVNPLLEIVLSLLLGAVAGVALSFFERFFHSGSKRLTLSLTFVILTVALAKCEFTLPGGVVFGFSPLLTCMMLGTLFCNICPFSEDMMEQTEKWTMPLYILFFTLSGAELSFNVFADWRVIVIGVVYILFRSAGKYVGARESAKATGCEANIVKYLGITLLPQAGVALGMATVVASTADFPDEVGVIVTNIILFSVLVYELIGPYFTKVALQKAGDIRPEGRTSRRTDENVNPEKK